YCSKIHWRFNDIVIVREVQFFNWFIKDPSLIVFPQCANKSLGCFIPAIIDGNIFIDFRDLELFNNIGVWAIEVSHEIWIFFLELYPLFITQRFILSILKNCQLISPWYLPLIYLWLLHRWCLLFLFFVFLIAGVV